MRWIPVPADIAEGIFAAAAATRQPWPEDVAALSVAADFAAGGVDATVAGYAAEWHWDAGRVRRHLDRLGVKLNRINQKSRKSRSRISLEPGSRLVDLQGPAPPAHQQRLPAPQPRRPQPAGKPETPELREFAELFRGNAAFRAQLAGGEVRSIEGFIKKKLETGISESEKKLIDAYRGKKQVEQPVEAEEQEQAQAQDEEPRPMTAAEWREAIRAMPMPARAARAARSRSISPAPSPGVGARAIVQQYINQF